MKRWITALMLSLAMLGSTVGLLATTSAPKAQAQSTYYWVNNYKRDWFYSIYKCRKWGRGAVYGNDVQRKIPGVIGFRCHRNWGELYWSIDLKWLVGTGSWAVRHKV